MEYHKIDEKLILDLFRISSPSGKETDMINFIKNHLDKYNISYTQDVKGNIFNLNIKDKPVLSSHMDTVEKPVDSSLMKFVNIRNYKNKKFIKGYGIIGGDDKCGIYIMLKLLENRKDFNFIFSVSEETGCLGIQEVVKKEDFSNVTYGIVLDRRNGGDIICDLNNYGTKEFENDLKEIGKNFGYSPVRGSVSDANHIRTKVSCANLSVGYYNPHSSKEYVSLEELAKSFTFVEKILVSLNKRYEPTKFVETPITYYKNNNYNYNNSGYCNFCYKHDSKFSIKVGFSSKICSSCLKDILDDLLKPENIGKPEIKNLVSEFCKKVNDLDKVPLLTYNNETEVEEEDIVISSREGYYSEYSSYD